MKDYKLKDFEDTLSELFAESELLDWKIRGMLKI